MKTSTAMLLLSASLAITAAAATGTAAAEVLLIERVQEEQKESMPVRGQSAAQVEARFGAPAERMDPRGGQKRQWPTINRWAYPEFTVYFENNTVIDVVLNKAKPQEIGPKPPIL